ncbi:hypothetical protein [Streptomyces sp. L2]|uniref:hypothetical protein n=1 Tax=Streptomyces sp. L2 TaxID=2162665 RepID=UPI0013E97ADB|nr:hypothetical protein [Streptomyces sp. L2]
MANRTDQPNHEHSPHTARDCNLCASLRHPARAAEGRALDKHLAANPLPRQTGGAR